MRAVASCGLSKEDGVLLHFSPACFSIDVCVFGSKSIAGCPAMVTVPVTSAHARQLPAIQLHQLDGVSDLHSSFDFATVYEPGGTHEDGAS